MFYYNKPDEKFMKRKEFLKTSAVAIAEVSSPKISPNAQHELRIRRASLIQFTQMLFQDK
jgi:hypothetical protein